MESRLKMDFTPIALPSVQEDKDQFRYHGKPIKKNRFYSRYASIGPLDHPAIKEDEDLFM
jgi:hypothetical protein